MSVGKAVPPGSVPTVSAKSSPSSTTRNLHLGCGHVYLAGWENWDSDWASAADHYGDLSKPHFDERAYDVIYSHAFFEHLWKHDREQHLRLCLRSLTPDGFLLYAGIPLGDYIMDAWAGGGVTRDDVERHLFGEYQPGDPEAGLHKGLVFADDIFFHLRRAGATAGRVFTYLHGPETTCWGGGFWAALKPQGDKPIQLLQRLIGAREIQTVLNYDLSV